MISELVEKSVGNRRAVQLLLLVPFLPKELFLGAKFRYFNRYNLDQDAADYIRILVKRPRISVALKLHQIMSSFGPLLGTDKETLDNIRLLRQLLITWKPRTSHGAYRKIRTLVKCFEFKRAETALQRFGHLLREDRHKELNDFFDATRELLDYFSPVTDTAWENSLRCQSQHGDEHSETPMTFYLPPTLTKLEMGSKSTASFYRHTNEFFKRLHQSIPRNRFKVEEKLQFSWRTIKEPLGRQLAISYHTRGQGQRNLRIKESAFSNYLTMDSTGYSGWHTVAELEQDNLQQLVATTPGAAMEQTYQELGRELVHGNVSKYHQREQSERSLQTKGDFFFVALQVANDIVAELAYIDTFNLLKSTTEIAEKYRIQLVIKRHPKCTSIKIKQLLKSLEGHQHIEISNASIHLIIPACKAVITVNSGVGMEALLHLKDVISTGKSEYACIAKTAHSKRELEQQMLNFSPTEPDKIKAFLHYYASEHLYRYDDSGKLQRFWQRNAEARQ